MLKIIKNPFNLLFLGYIFLKVVLDPAFLPAQSAVNGYVRSNGTYISPYTRNDANSVKSDNYGSKRDSNDNSYKPYDGKPSSESLWKKYAPAGTIDDGNDD